MIPYLFVLMLFNTLTISTMYCMEEIQELTALHDDQLFKRPLLKKAKTNNKWLSIVQETIISPEAQQLITSLRQQDPKNYPGVLLVGKRSAQLTAHVIASALSLPYVSIKPAHLTNKDHITEIAKELDTWCTKKTIAVLLSNVSALTIEAPKEWEALLQCIPQNCLLIVSDTIPEKLPNKLKERLLLHPVAYPTSLTIPLFKDEKNIYSLYSLCTAQGITEIGESFGNSKDISWIECKKNRNEICKKFAYVNLYSGSAMYPKLLAFLSQFDLTKTEGMRLSQPQTKKIGRHSQSINHYYIKQECNCSNQPTTWLENIKLHDHHLDLAELKQKIDLLNQKKAIMGITYPAKEDEKTSPENEEEANYETDDECFEIVQEEPAIVSPVITHNAPEQPIATPTIVPTTLLENAEPISNVMSNETASLSNTTKKRSSILKRLFGKTKKEKEN